MSLSPPAAPALHLQRREDEAAGSGALRPAHVEALPFVGAIADAGFEEAEGACGAEQSGTGQAEPPTLPRPSWRPPPRGRRSPCSVHLTASMAGPRPRPPFEPANPAAPAPPPISAGRGQGGQSGHSPRAPVGGNRVPRGRGHMGGVVRRVWPGGRGSSCQLDTPLKVKYLKVNVS